MVEGTRCGHLYTNVTSGAGELVDRKSSGGGRFTENPRKGSYLLIGHPGLELFSHF